MTKVGGQFYLTPAHRENIDESREWKMKKQNILFTTIKFTFLVLVPVPNYRHVWVYPYTS